MNYFMFRYKLILVFYAPLHLCGYIFTKLQLFLIILLSTTALADEGMWLPLLLKQIEPDMQARGMRLSAEDIYSVNRSSLKDAVVHFGGGCTAEIISPDGLLITNHHCGYYQVQQYSSVENDYLTNGFWAMRREEELAGKDLSVTFIVRMEDVTKYVLTGIVKDEDEKKRQAIVESNIKILQDSATKGTHYDAFVRPFYYGNEYYLFITETYKDVRLVGAPPSSIGKFGGDTDNWMWPRHTGDFSLFRIYADSSNKPAPYSKNNVPFKPRHYLPVSLKGVHEGDFTMVFGFPGNTQQYLTSYAVEYILNKGNPARIKLRETGLSIMESDMKSNDAIRIQYAAKYARISNYWKKWIGENRGLKKLNAIEKKKSLETEFIRIVENKPENKILYGSLLNNFETLYKAREKYAFWRDYYIETYLVHVELPKYAYEFKSLIDCYDKNKCTDTVKQKKLEQFRDASSGFYKDFHLLTDRKMFSSLMKLFYDKVDKNMHPGIFNEVQKKCGGNFEKYADELYSRSVFADKIKIKALLEKGNPSSIKKLRKDPVYVFAESLTTYFSSNIKPQYDSLSSQLERMNRTYMDALKKLMPNYRKYYPDANSTLRVAFGKVEGYLPMDAVNYGYYTTIDGIIEKADPNSDEFNVPDKLTELYKNKDFGTYAKDGKLRVAFVASNHTTGGNSGSPVIDADGNLIGVNFDRTWESTMSDIMFDPERCRNIAVDMNYVLFVIDKVAGAKHLVDEMKLVR